MKFIASEQAWSVALQLLEMPQAQNSEYFIGAQAIYQKLDRDFDGEFGSKLFIHSFIAEDWVTRVLHKVQVLN